MSHRSLLGDLRTATEATVWKAIVVDIRIGAAVVVEIEVGTARLTIGLASLDDQA